MLATAKHNSSQYKDGWVMNKRVLDIMPKINLHHDDKIGPKKAIDCLKVYYCYRSVKYDLEIESEL